MAISNNAVSNGIEQGRDFMTDLVCISPIDGRELVRRQTATSNEIAATLARLASAQKSWAQVSLAERAAILDRFLDILRAQNDDVAVELAWQMGRPVRYGGEFRSFEERVRTLIDLAPSALAPMMPADHRDGLVRHIVHAPLGIVFVVAPWNFPYLTAVNTIVPALMAGNAVLLKHAAQTLLVGDRFQAALDAAGLPPGLFCHIALSHNDTARILSTGSVDHITFTGSVGGGRAIEHAAAGTFTSCTLELGGKDPAYVRADADLDFAVENIVDGAYFNSGQSCCGVERIYVHENLYSSFVERFAALTSQYLLGNPLDSATTLGPMAATRFADLVRAQTADALSRNGTALIDPALFPADKDGTSYLMPQAVINVDHSMAIMREENFGPLVGIMRVRDDDEAVRLMNDSAYGLTASIWTADIAAAEVLGNALDCGTVFANRCDYVDPGLAWSGVKNTGRGASVGQLGYNGLTRPKSIHLREV
jgi:acyl-CoA reductase-like NAD-dependent aldehyde dehydrogenase